MTAHDAIAAATSGAEDNGMHGILKAGIGRHVLPRGGAGAILPLHEVTWGARHDITYAARADRYTPATGIGTLA